MIPPCHQGIIIISQLNATDNQPLCICSSGSFKTSMDTYNLAIPTGALKQEPARMMLSHYLSGISLFLSLIVKRCKYRVPKPLEPQHSIFLPRLDLCNQWDYTSVHPATVQTEEGELSDPEPMVFFYAIDLTPAEADSQPYKPQALAIKPEPINCKYNVYTTES